MRVTTWAATGVVFVWTFPRGINGNGDIVGNFVDRSGRTHGFIARVLQ